MRGQKVLHEAEHTPLTFNFLAGNQEAEENEALNVPSVASGALLFQGRTYHNCGPGNSQILEGLQKLEGLYAYVSKHPRSA